MSDPAGRLRDEIKEGRAVFVVGAGVSLAATGGNEKMGWRGLLEDGLKKVERLGTVSQDSIDTWLRLLGIGDTDELILVASMIEQRLEAPHNGRFKDWLREVFEQVQVSSTEVLDALSLLAEAGCFVATTNYDGLIESHTRYLPITWRDENRVDRFLRGQERAILHLHGYWEDPISIILGGLSYERQATQLTSHYMKVLRTPSTGVFVGFGQGLDDPNIGRLLDWAARECSRLESCLFFLERHDDVDERRRRYPPTNGFDVLDYGNRYEDLGPFLKGLLPGGGGGHAGGSVPARSATAPPNAPSPSDRPPAYTIILKTKTKRVTVEEEASIVYAVPPVLADASLLLAPDRLEYASLPGFRDLTELPKASAGETLAQPVFRPFRDCGTAGDGLMTKRGLDSPGLQGSFRQLGRHREFLKGFDPKRSYRFRGEDKTGKTSWLGFLGQKLLSDPETAKFEPIWVGSCPRDSNAHRSLTSWLGDPRRVSPDRCPVLLVDDIHLQPDLLFAIHRLKEFDSPWRDVPVYCTFLRNPPEDAEERKLWDESRAAWPSMEKWFENRDDLVGHIVVCEEGNLTDDASVASRY